jgi:hypothetical protein
MAPPGPDRSEGGARTPWSTGKRYNSSSTANVDTQVTSSLSKPRPLTGAPPSRQTDVKRLPSPVDRLCAPPRLCSLNHLAPPRYVRAPGAGSARSDSPGKSALPKPFSRVLAAPTCDAEAMPARACAPTGIASFGFSPPPAVRLPSTPG